MELFSSSGATVNLTIISRLSHLEVVIPIAIQIDIVRTVREREDVLLDPRSQFVSIYSCCGCNRTLLVCLDIAAKSTFLLLFLDQVFQGCSF